MSAAVKAARAVYRGYFSAGRKQSALVTRLHVIRDTPVRSQSRHFAAEPGEVTWCGQSAGPHRNSEPVIISPLPDRPPGGLAWCPACVGHLAERYGLLGEIAASLAAYDPELTDLSGERWQSCADEQRAVRRRQLEGRQ